MSSGKFVVTARARPEFEGAWRSGRLWSSSSPTEIEVLDQEDDPPRDRRRIGKRTLRALQADPLFVVKEVPRQGDGASATPLDGSEKVPSAGKVLT